LQHLSGTLAVKMSSASASRFPPFAWIVRDATRYEISSSVGPPNYHIGSAMLPQEEEYQRRVSRRGGMISEIPMAVRGVDKVQYHDSGVGRGPS